MCNIDERQEELNEIIKKFNESRFYEEYRDKYVSDVILKKVLDSDLRLHRLRGLKTYSDVHSFNVKVMTDFIKLFKKPMQIENDAVLWQMLQAF